MGWVKFSDNFKNCRKISPNPHTSLYLLAEIETFDQKTLTKNLSESASHSLFSFAMRPRKRSLDMMDKPEPEGDDSALLDERLRNEVEILMTRSKESIQENMFRSVLPLNIRMINLA